MLYYLPLSKTDEKAKVRQYAPIAFVITQYHVITVGLMELCTLVQKKRNDYHVKICWKYLFLN